jgi:NAD+ synthase
MEELAERITAWIGEKVAEAKCKGVVFGLSGGLDSSVVGVLCKRAFPDNTLAVIMPCYSDETDIAHAQAVVQKFQIPTTTIALEGVFDSLLKVLPDENDPATKKLAEANVKVRLRMVTLYYLANRLCYLVVGTSNRSELSVGYFTKYGDGGVDIMPLGNLVKSQVRQLAIHLGIPEEIIAKPPSAGLWAGQTDEREMGITYQELDRYLASGEAEAELKRRVDAMVEGSAHKRSTPAIPPF